MAPCCPSSVTSQPLHVGRVWHCWPCSAAPSTCLWFCTFSVCSLAFSFIPAPQCLHSPGFWTVSICLPAPFDPLSSTGSCFLPLNTIFAASSAPLLSSHASPAVLEHATTSRKHLPVFPWYSAIWYSVNYCPATQNRALLGFLSTTALPLNQLPSCKLGLLVLSSSAFIHWPHQIHRRPIHSVTPNSHCCDLIEELHDFHWD